TRYVLYWQLAELGVKCDVIAPTLVPMKSGERVKRLEQAITEAVKLASPEIQEVVKDLQALRGAAQISAVTIVAELGNISRFEGARQLMAYSGTIPSEDSSGQRTRRGSITKTGNAHLRRIAVEAAWSYRLRPCIGPALRKRQEGVPEEIEEIAWKARNRLHKRYMRLTAAGKDQRKIVTAIGRELLGFIWTIEVKAEAAGKLRMAA
ncbi:MAG: transposase, partial [Terracidiphilus sp.]